MITHMRRLATAGAVLVLAGACVRGDPVSPAGNEEGNALLFTGTATNPSPVLPSGTADVRITLDVDPTVADAFTRIPPTAPYRQLGRAWSPANAAWLFRTDVMRNANPETIDTRFPFPTSTTATFGGSGLQLYQPESPYPADEYWEAFTVLTGLKPNTTYQMAFVQYRLTVNGSVDHAARILSGVVLNPDTLKLATGTPGAVNTDWSGTAPAGCAAFPGATTNPFVFATFTTDGNGGATLDKCWQSGNGIWTAAEFGQQAKNMIGRNDNTAYSLPNYNYVEVWETSFGTGTGPAMRMQIAQDLDPAGAPVANAYAPFPAPNTITRFVSDNLFAAAVDQSAAFPISYTTALALPSTFGSPDSVTVSLTNLEALSSGTYKVWYVNPTTNQAAPATGRWVRVLGADTIASSTGTSTFDGGPGTVIFTTDPYGVIGQPDVSDSLSVLLVSIEQNAGATSPSSAQPIWTTVIKKVGGSVGGAVRFVEFTLGDDSRGPEVFGAQGTMAGGIIGDTVVVLVDTTINGAATKIRAAQFVGNRVEVRFTGLMRPPLGYRYRAYLCGSATGACDPTSASTVFFDVGGLMSPGGVSLDNADSAPNDSNLSSTRIVSAFASATVSGGQTLCEFDRFRLVLEPTDGAGPPLAHIFDAALPAQLTGARSCR